MKTTNLLIFISIFISMFGGLQAMNAKNLKSTIANHFADRLIKANPNQAQELLREVTFPQIDRESEQEIKQLLINKIDSLLPELINIERSFELEDVCHPFCPIPVPQVSAVFNHDGTLLLTLHQMRYRGERVSIWDATSGKCLATTDINDDADAAITDYENTVTLAMQDGFVIGTPRDNQKISQEMALLAWDSENGKLLGSYSVPFFSLYDLVRGRWVIMPHNDWTFSAPTEGQKITAFMFDRKSMKDFTDKVWNPAKLKTLSEIVDTSIVYLATLNSNGTEAAVVNNGRLELWNLCSQTRKTTFDVNPDSLVFSHDDNRLLLSRYYGAAVLDINTNKYMFELPHSSALETASFNFDDTKIVTASYDGTITIWDMPKKHLQSMSLPAITLLLKLKQHGPLILESDFYQKLNQGLTPAEQEIIKTYLKTNIQE